MHQGPTGTFGTASANFSNQVSDSPEKSRYLTTSSYGLFRKDYKPHPKERKTCAHYNS